MRRVLVSKDAAHAERQAALSTEGFYSLEVLLRITSTLMSRTEPEVLLLLLE